MITMKVTGLEVSGSKILLASVKRKKKSFNIVHLYTVDIASPSQKKDVKRLYTSFRFEKDPIVTGLEAKDVLLNRSEWKAAPKRVLQKVLQFQLESENFLDPKETIFVPYLSSSLGKTNLSLFSTSKKILRTHLEYIKEYSLDPQYVSLTAQALWRFAKEIAKVEDCFVLHIAHDYSTLILIKEGTLLRFYSFSSAINTAAGSKNNQIENYKKELSAAFFSLCEEEKIAKKTLPLLLTGIRDTRLPSLQKILEEDYSSLLFFPEREEMQEWRSYAVPIGLALDASAQDEKRLQFRKDEFVSKAYLRTLGKKLVFFLVCSFILSALVIFFVSKNFHLQKKSLENTLQEALEQDSLLSRRAIPAGTSEERLLSWRKILKKETKAFPYLLKAPKVAEVLHWLQKHPILCENGKAYKLYDFHYELINYPKLDSLNDPYLAKVELDLEIPSTVIANKFHEALLNGEWYVNGANEIQWEKADNRYKISFYLKERL